MSQMLHNKYFQILELFMGNYLQEVHGRSLVGKIGLSQKAIALTLDELEKLNILKSRKTGNMKYFRLNLLNTEIRDLFKITELIRKMNFFQKHRKIAHLFRKEDKDKIIGIFGSYAQGTAKKDSDLDLFIIGNNKKEKYSQSGKILGLEISLKFFSEKELVQLLQEKNFLIKEIIQNHLLIFGTEKFVNLIWRHYYGFD